MVDGARACIPNAVPHGVGLFIHPGYVYLPTCRIILLTVSIATSVDVERTFSRGRLLLSHVRNRLSAQSTRAILCLGDWVRWDLVHTQDIQAVVKSAEVQNDEGDDYRMDPGWDRISAILEAK